VATTLYRPRVMSKTFEIGFPPPLAVLGSRCSRLGQKKPERDDGEERHGGCRGKKVRGRLELLKKPGGHYTNA